MKQKIITITTDLGDQFASAQLEAVACSLGFTGKLIQNHSITSFSITGGAFEMAALSRFCPKGTIHLGIVDPGVGSNRRGVIIKTKHFWFVGPDNGLLFLAANKDHIEKAWQLTEDKINKSFSNTFHGRDIFIKAAVYLGQNKKPEVFGSKPINPSFLQKLKLESGQVVHVDHYGNIKIYWPQKVTLGKEIHVKNGHSQFDLPVVKTFSDVAANQPLALLGSNKTLEIAINLGNAAKKYNLSLANQLHISYK